MHVVGLLPPRRSSRLLVLVFGLLNGLWATSFLFTSYLLFLSHNTNPQFNLLSQANGIHDHEGHDFRLQNVHSHLESSVSNKFMISLKDESERLHSSNRGPNRNGDKYAKWPKEGITTQNKQSKIDNTNANNDNIHQHEEAGRTKININNDNVNHHEKARTTKIHGVSDDRKWNQMETMKRLTRLGGDEGDVINMQTLIKEFSILDEIPQWSEVASRYYTTSEGEYKDQQVVLGLDSCKVYRQTVPIRSRVVAPAGLFHTGTNLLAELMKESCILPEDNDREERNHSTFFWQVPWGKHNPIELHLNDSYVLTKYQERLPEEAVVLPIVLVRHPVDWMHSMCRQPYATKWKYDHQCPGLLKKNSLPQDNITNDFNPIRVALHNPKWYDSILHFWNQWNREYVDLPQKKHLSLSTTNQFRTLLSPSSSRLMVRLEDIVYKPEQVLNSICDCVGGKLSFDSDLLLEHYGGADEIKTPSRNPVVEAWIRHANVTMDSMTVHDQKATKDVVDTQLLRVLQYKL